MERDVLWLLPLLLAALLMLPTARAWWIVAHGKEAGAVPDRHLRRAAEYTAFTVGLAGAALLALLALRFL